MISIPLQRSWVKWSLAFAFWTAVGLIFSTQNYFYFASQDEGFTWIQALKDGMPKWYIWGALSPLIIHVDRRLRLRREQLFKRVLFHIPLSVFWILVHFGIRLSIEKLFNGEMTLRFSDLVGGFHMNIQIYWLILGVYVAYDYFNAYRERELTASQLETRLAEARLHSLHAQLHPHFLFNTLNAITAFMEKDPKTARLMTAHLGDLLRFSLEHENKQEITLAEELSLLEHYLEIQRIRFADRLAIQIDIAPATLNALVPSLLLQPLVENAIRHGIAPRASSGYVKVQSERENGMLRLQVRDNGLGLPDGWKQGVGLTNTRERLARLYHHEHRFEINNAANEGVVVEIALPFRLESNHEADRHDR